MSRTRHRLRRPHALRQARRRPQGPCRDRARRDRDPRGARAQRARGQRGRLRDHGPGAAGRRRARRPRARRRSARGCRSRCPSDTINKVCASSIRAVEIADSMIRAGDVEVVVTGGMESMSNAPYALPKARFGYKMGDGDARRPDDLGRAALDVRRAAHGAAGGARRARARHLARGAGRAGRCARTSARRRRRTTGCFDDEIVPVGEVDRRREHPPRHDARAARSAEAGDGSRRDDHRGQRAGRERRRVVRGRVLGGVREAARPRAARDDRLAGLRRGRVRVARAHARERRRAGAREGRQVDRRREAGRGERGVLVGRAELRRRCSAPIRRR